ncbi:MAG: cytochrome b/b6 domain-containing protein, partial [Pseudomonadota bacterium]
MNSSTKIVKVWDPLVRIGHWLLIIAFFTAYFTEDDFLTQHVWAGYTVAIVVLSRIIWGMIGTKYARFANFIYTPKTICSYFKSLITGKPQHYVGHNPAGGVMIIALLLSLCATVYTGLALYAVEKNAGPLASLLAEHNQSTPIATITSTAKVGEYANKQHLANEQSEGFWEGLHEFFANFTLLLVALHIGGVLLSSYIDKENLIKAMVTGYKVRPKDGK